MSLVEFHHIPVQLPSQRFQVVSSFWQRTANSSANLRHSILLRKYENFQLQEFFDFLTSFLGNCYVFAFVKRSFEHYILFKFSIFFTFVSSIIYLSHTKLFVRSLQKLMDCFMYGIQIVCTTNILHIYAFRIKNW